VLYWEDKIVKWANERELDPNLVATVMQIESCGDPKALSPAGAMGLFQVMPYHFNTSEDPYHPNTNAKRGLAYLREALDRYNSVRLAFAGYNGGISTAGKAENLWKAETQRYVYWGTNIYQDARQGMSHSPTLDEWLSHGGASLCAQARQRLDLSP
jgi:soluble lytic murein transglycosylase-like protein